MPFKNHLIWGSYHYENNDGNGWSWGSEPAWDTTHDLRLKTKNHTAAAQWQWSPNGNTAASAKFLGILERRPTVSARVDRLDHPGYINWWKWADYGINGAFPYVDAQKASRQTIQADLSHYAEGFLGSARHQVRRAVHERARQSAGRLLPELRELPLPVPLDAERVRDAGAVRRHRTALLQLQETR